MITLDVSHIFFQLFVIERIISRTLSNFLEFPFDYVPRSLFIGNGLILGWITNIGYVVVTWRKFSPKETTAVPVPYMGMDPTNLPLQIHATNK